MKKTTKKVTTTKRKSSKKKMSVLEAKSANTGLSQHFGNLPAWKKRMKEYENKYGSRIEVDLSNALSFVTFLSSQRASFTLSSSVAIKAPVYRVVAPVFAAFYVASDLKCALAEAAWVLQKAPLASQIIAWYLRQKGGDGIVFPSAKEPSSKNFALWFTTDKDSEKSFDIAEVAIPD